jgi:hypothetical protein
MRRLRHDWATHGWNWNYLWTRPARIYSVKESCSIWAETTLCECFYDPSFKGMGRFKDTPSMNHRKRSCNGKDGDQVNEYKAQQRLEVEKEIYGTKERLRKRMHRLDPRRMKVTCICGFLLGHVWVSSDESRYTAVSKKFGDRRPRCPNCDAKVKGRLGLVSMPA